MKRRMTKKYDEGKIYIWKKQYETKGDKKRRQKMKKKTRKKE